MVYVLAVLAAAMIIMRARSLFFDVEKKEREVETLLGNVRQAFTGKLGNRSNPLIVFFLELVRIQESTEHIHESLSGFKQSTQK